MANKPLILINPMMPSAEFVERVIEVMGQMASNQDDGEIEILYAS